MASSSQDLIHPEQDVMLKYPGRIVASPHPDYLFAMLSGSATSYALVHSQARENAATGSSDGTTPNVRYLPQWSIGEIVDDSLAAEGINNHDDDPEGGYVQQAANRFQILASIQSQVVQEYDKVRDLVYEWLSSDAEEKLRCKNDPRIPVHIDSETISQANGLVMRSYWRRELGWKGDRSINSINKGKKFEFFAESFIPAQPSDNSAADPKATVRWKYIWDHENGTWAYGWDSQGTKEKRMASRMKHLDEQVQEIAEIRDAALKENGMGYMTKLNADMRVDCQKVGDGESGRQEASSLIDKRPEVEKPALAGMETGSVQHVEKPDQHTAHDSSLAARQNQTGRRPTIIRLKVRTIASHPPENSIPASETDKSTLRLRASTAMKRKFSEDHDNSNGDNRADGNDHDSDDSGDEYRDSQEEEEEDEEERNEDDSDESRRRKRTKLTSSFPAVKRAKTSHTDPSSLSSSEISPSSKQMTSQHQILRKRERKNQRDQKKESGLESKPKSKKKTAAAAAAAAAAVSRVKTKTKTARTTQSQNQK